MNIVKLWLIKFEKMSKLNWLKVLKFQKLWFCTHNIIRFLLLLLKKIMFSLSCDNFKILSSSKVAKWEFIFLFFYFWTDYFNSKTKNHIFLIAYFSLLVLLQKIDDYFVIWRKKNCVDLSVYITIASRFCWKFYGYDLIIFSSFNFSNFI